MSNSGQVSESLTVTGDGITVTKEFGDDEFPYPTIRLELANERDETVTMQVREDVPEEFSAEAIGFHPEYENDKWSCREDTAEFRRGRRRVTGRY